MLSRLDEAISVLRRNKAPGHDNISNEMLKEAYDIIKIPEAWTTSNSAILSKPAKDDYNSAKLFRITLSSCTLKLMERLI